MDAQIAKKGKNDDEDETLSDKERAFFTYSAANYVKLKDLHLAEGYDTL